MIDTHCHLDAAEFDADRAQAQAAANAAGVHDIIVPGVAVDAFAKQKMIVAACPGAHAAYGIHPLYVASASDQDLVTVGDWIARENPLAVGEIGLDFFIANPDIPRQTRFFTAQLKLAREFDLPVILHVRRAVDAVLRALRRIRVRGGVAHAFNGSRQQADEFLKLGFKLGFGGAATYSGSSRIRQLAATLPAEAIVLETDAPDITHPGYFSFYQPGMSFEAFVSHFAEWFSQRRPAAVLVGIRADESLNRFMTISSQRKQRFADDKPWTTSAPGGHAWYIYPLYDWKTADIWTWFAKSGEPYNPLYDLMYQAGVPLRYMRICEPFGPEQRQGLWLYHVLEPERWAAMCQRVSGAHSGGVYAGHDNQFYGHRKIDKPDHLTWKSYALFLLDSMPETTAEHYRNKIAVYLRWYQKKGMEDIPDTQPADIGTKDIPSWRRVCKVLLNNDYWCRQLSFSPTKSSHYQRYRKRMEKHRQQWGILCNNN